MRFLLICGLAVWLLMSWSASAQSITDLFIRLPDSYFKTELASLTSVNRKQIVAKKTTKGFRMNLADVKNAYLTCTGNNDSGGVVIEMTYWKQPDNSLLIGLIHNQYTTINNQTSHVYFIKVTGQQFTDVTAQHLPNLTLPDFYAPAFNAKKLTAILDLRWLWTLPRVGTTIEIAPPTFDDSEADQGKLLAQARFYYELKRKGAGFELSKRNRPKQ